MKKRSQILLKLTVQHQKLKLKVNVILKHLRKEQACDRPEF